MVVPDSFNSFCKYCLLLHGLIFVYIMKTGVCLLNQYKKFFIHTVYGWQIVTYRLFLPDSSASLILYWSILFDWYSSSTWECRSASQRSSLRTRRTSRRTPGVLEAPSSTATTRPSTSTTASSWSLTSNLLYDCLWSSKYLIVLSSLVQHFDPKVNNVLVFEHFRTSTGYFHIL